MADVWKWIAATLAAIMFSGGVGFYSGYIRVRDELETRGVYIVEGRPRLQAIEDRLTKAEVVAQGNRENIVRMESKLDRILEILRGTTPHGSPRIPN